MRTFYKLNDFLKFVPSSYKCVATIGVFDGVHLAHQKIVRRVMGVAKMDNIKTLVITFNPHPTNVLNKSIKVPLLISLKHRLRLFDETGIDYALVLQFNKRFARMQPGDFIKKVLGRMHLCELIVGRNFLFGNKKRGTFADLVRFSKDHDFKISAVGTYRSSGKAISSTRIRRLILNGELKRASKLLSRAVTVLGTVVKGYKRGRLIGFRTANIDPHHEAIPPSGVYAVRIRFEGKRLKGILNIGVKPTFNDSNKKIDPTIEVHIFNFNKVIYGKDLEIEFVRRIRGERRFKDAHSLRLQIERDEELSKNILSFR
ncbi:MAG: bifunctional riboflavin kinase/FAD synthetase [Candidatus Omnitrophota bacterium]